MVERPFDTGVVEFEAETVATLHQSLKSSRMGSRARTELSGPLAACRSAMIKREIRRFPTGQKLLAPCSGAIARRHRSLQTVGDDHVGGKRRRWRCCEY